jgi:hypothetical protein
MCCKKIEDYQIVDQFWNYYRKLWNCVKIFKIKGLSSIASFCRLMSNAHDPDAQTLRKSAIELELLITSLG